MSSPFSTPATRSAWRLAQRLPVRTHQRREEPERRPGKRLRSEFSKDERRQIVLAMRLEQPPAMLEKIAARLNLSKTAVSGHIRKLKAAGLLPRERQTGR